MVSDSLRFTPMVSNLHSASEAAVASRLPSSVPFSVKYGPSLAAATLFVAALFSMLLWAVVGDANRIGNEIQVRYDIKKSEARSDDSGSSWGSFVVRVSEEMKKDAILVEYKLENFFQNHMWYMRNKDEKQLREGEVLHFIWFSVILLKLKSGGFFLLSCCCKYH